MTTAETRNYRTALAAEVNNASPASRPVLLRDLIAACARGLGYALPNGRVCRSADKAAAAWQVVAKQSA